MSKIIIKTHHINTVPDDLTGRVRISPAAETVKAAQITTVPTARRYRAAR